MVSQYFGKKIGRQTNGSIRICTYDDGLFSVCELQGALGSLMGLTTLIAPPLMTSSFSYFTGKQSEIYFPGIPFLIASILTLISLILFLKSFKKSNRLIKSVDK